MSKRRLTQEEARAIFSSNKYCFSIDDKNQLPLDKKLIDSNVSIPIKFYIDILKDEINKLLHKNCRNYNNNCRLYIRLSLFPKEIFNTLFAKAQEKEYKGNDKKKQKINDSKTTFNVEPIYLSYIFGIGWWSIETTIDKRSKAINATFYCNSLVRISFDYNTSKLSISFTCGTKNTHGIIQ